MSAAPTAPLAETRPRASRVPVLALYSATLTLSAALVFMVQPMFARLLLPLLGGTPAVWTVALLFFQTALLLAYLYAHWTTRRFGVRRQAALHLALVAGAMIVLPIGVPDGWTPPTDSSPIPWLLAVLVVAVGLPYFVVSSTAPLLQSWLADTDHPDAADPYFLYRASNVGSVVGLLAYPVLVEPGLGLDAQGWLWSAGYGLFAVLIVACALVLWRARRHAGTAAIEDPVESSKPITAARRLWWVALAFVPSSLMLAGTTALSLNVAPMPLLWVLPLSLYLASFVVVFSRSRGTGLARRVARLAMPPLAVALAGVIALGQTEPLWLVGLIHLAALFAVALVCHGELAGDRPASSHLTEFYAFVSLGGALGGVFNGVIAPMVFDHLTEYPIALVLACLMLPAAGAWKQISPAKHVLPAVLLGAAALLAFQSTEGSSSGLWITAGAAGMACVLLSRHPLRFGLAVGAVMAATWIGTLDDSRAIHQERSFFGVHRVEVSADDILHELWHGTILHGGQVGGRAIDGVAYYHPHGPIGQVLDALPDREVARRAAVVGLGAGAMACHTRSGDRWTFYEIDPTVERIARNPELFSYLRDCKGSFDVVLGDGRLSLAKERDAGFGLIVLDAFGSDAVPVHLLTRDAVELYADKLAPSGVMAFHISNKYLDLEPVVGNVAAAAGLSCFAQNHEDVTPAQARGYMLPSHWVAMARSRDDLGRLPADRRWHACERDEGARTWTDDYSNVVGAIKWN